MAVAVSCEGLDCRKCSDNEKIEHGFEEDSPVKNKWQIGEWKFQRCPVQFVKRQSVAYMEAYPLFKLGVMPNGQGWLNESKKFLQAMHIIEKEIRSKDGKSK